MSTLEVTAPGAALRALVETHDNFVLDCDGVLWHGTALLPHVRETLQLLKAKGKTIRYVTNNSSKSRVQYQKKFEGLGLETAVEEIIPSSYAAAELLKRHHPEVKKAFVIGKSGLHDELREVAGVEAFSLETLPGALPAVKDGEDLMKIQVDPDIKAVVCGWDNAASFTHNCVATTYIREVPDCVFVASNLDATMVVAGSDGSTRFMPGSGAGCAMVAVASGRQPKVAGKPSDFLIELLQEQGLDMARTVVVGDRLDTDVALGNRAGATTLCVLSGVSNHELVQQETTHRPTIVAEQFGDIFLSFQQE